MGEFDDMNGLALCLWSLFPVSPCRALTSLIGLDSVSEHLAHNAPCPVLIFKH